MFEEKDFQFANLSKADKAATNGIEKLAHENDESHSSDVNNDDEILQSNDSGIIITNATAKWTNSQAENSLENINLTVKPGRLVAIIGPVGAGKVRIHNIIKSRGLNLTLTQKHKRMITEFVNPSNFTRITTFRR